MESQSAVSTILRNQSADPLFTPIETANYIGVTEKTLAVWRCTGRYNIPFIKVGRLVKYRKSALDTFLVSRTHGGEV
ncbi:helix-turn-helix protein [Nitrosomonas ureae]|uniref:helix-turn-helix domain-containing protein n=1 Tax=Nitrosomonas ureae TaxID=44577 RepID=UPI000D75F9E0|nr:helix-turn-helix domain-containing protein [Nitrosomonas ureae]PXX07517.1 helix-turn-helix protein [Nitrosomonas ureae]